MITTVIITKNEEHNIRRCLESVKWTDEIIIIDSGSMDKTLEIAKEYTSKIFQTGWLGFGRTKNFGFEKSQNEWILSLDADEEITEELKNEIIGVLVNPKFDGYSMPRRLFFCGHAVKYGGISPDYQLRLFKKSKGKFSDDPVHEYVILDGERDRLKNIMNHFSYNSMSEYWDRFNKYTTLDAKKKLEKNKKFSFLAILILPWENFRRLIIKRGLLDGYPGIFYHVFSAVSSFVKYAKLWELNNSAK
ncbi:glycosyltransferase family 2 protein [bacterium]